MRWLKRGLQLYRTTVALGIKNNMECPVLSELKAALFGVRIPIFVARWIYSH